MFDMYCCAHHCLKTLFWEKEKGQTFIVDQSSCALSTQELVCRYVYTACTEASSLAGDFCDALQPPAYLRAKDLGKQVVHTHTHTLTHIHPHTHIPKLSWLGKSGEIRCEFKGYSDSIHSGNVQLTLAGAFSALVIGLFVGLSPMTRGMAPA